MSLRSKLGQAMLVGGAGAVAAHFLDPDRGRARRARTRDRAISRSRRIVEAVETRARYTEGRIDGVRARADGRGRLHPVDDHVVKQAVEQRLASSSIDTSAVVVDVADGVVGLRGQLASPHEIRRVRREAESVRGISDVQSWLHVPGQPAPNKSEALGATR